MSTTPRTTPRLVLAIDTASAAASVALGDGDTLRAERRWTIETTISQELLAAVAALLSEAGVHRAAIEALAVCVGPGGYGGLRAGVATAQGMALALGVPLAAVSRLEADAAPYLAAAPPGRAVVAVHDAGRSGLAWAAYARPAPGAPEVALMGPTMTSAVECAQTAPAGAIWCGELSDTLAEARSAAQREGDSIAAPSSASRAAAVLELARKRASYDDPGLADVIYLRPPSITRPNTPPAQR
ncbi:MAG: tRNA (adenosine(37)-N6)-threonylcarbamoyltransferase complex dimerization subunit type 1 TsaB [Chloroflexi bacterium]|nr:tRNA (adenosine(37)-N6)-threonylcarbamoyltransferase complex dimerization subunit type 1 TsaB [Chloroflexota bacterium]MDA1146156.1 tRNA (adenosine(37)-N6)-threonylcarbamoyltransferase complex dimerization subunit type 1 TsaB [Chloroflexota bacterium]